ncbi:TetR/AcrR family transcriptional regulator [Oribacterium sinus]|uniref:Transcriptional regulator, TetR family n=1 Tax=Oribacterium sinus F0268 TaxID=585501 RepID=C2L0A3_9FIRM|nr:TetR/AcrR family transcriptional regulator [Oribacterium sinus]EEJ50555.1 transcriptional regulator, TetR family [Oribacterium sinus F0268]
MKKSQNPSTVRSRREISTALLKLMQEHPYAEISVKQIIMETSLARKTFYLNFRSKDDVLESILDELIGEYTAALSKANEKNNPAGTKYLDEAISVDTTGKVDTITNPLSVIFSFCDKNKDLLSLLHKSKMLYLLLLRLNEFLPEYSKTEDMSSNPFVKLMGELEPDYLIAFNVGAIWNVLFKWIDRGMVDSLDSIQETLKKYLKRISV